MIVLYKILNQLNKWVLPSMIHKDLTKLKTWEKAIVGYRYWVLCKILD